MSVKLNPYLNFNGNTKEAMEFYHEIFGGELKLNTFGEFPDCPEGYEDKIMHAALEGEEVSIMASESMPGGAYTQGTNFSISLSGETEDGDKLTKYFEQLGDGGQVTMQLDKQVWGDTYGMVKDKFGINWMVNIAGSTDDKAAM